MPVPNGLPILQGATDETQTQFIVLRSSHLPLSYAVRDAAGKTAGSVVIRDCYVHPAWPDDAVERISVTGLQLGTDYFFEIFESATGSRLDQRLFRTLDTKKPRGRAAIISCLCDDFVKEQAEMWKVVADQKPDIVFLIGDEAYLDGRQSDDERGMWRRHLEIRKALDLFRWQTLIPVVSVWDDHDFGINDGDSSFPLKDATRKMFDVMFGADPVAGFTAGPSLAREFQLFGQRYYLMDDRWYRTKGVTHWGEEQEEWLFSRLNLSQSPAVLMNGSQYFGAYSKYESFEGEHPQQFARVLKRLSQTEAPVVFASGDRHFSEVMAMEPNLLGYSTFEFTSSSLHSYAPEKLPSAVNPRRVLATIAFNFILLESQSTLSGSSSKIPTLDIDAKCFGAGSQLLFNHTSKIDRAI